MIETRFAVKLNVLISNSIFIDYEEEEGDEDGNRCVNRPSAHRRSNYLFDARVINSQRWLILLLGLDSQKWSTIYWAKYYCVKICSLLDMCVFILDDQPNHCSNAEIGKFHCRNATGYLRRYQICSIGSLNEPLHKSKNWILANHLY